MVLILIVPAFAGKPTPEPQQTQTVISEYMEILLPNTDYVIMTVPSDKTFILTDMIFSASNASTFAYNMYLKEDSNIKIPNLYITNSRPINLISGIPLASGSDVIVNVMASTTLTFIL